MRAITSGPAGRRQHGRCLLAGLLAGATLHAQAQALPDAGASATIAPVAGWQACQNMDEDPGAQLKCFKQWAEVAQSAPAPMAVTAAPQFSESKPTGCRNSNYSALSRFWELQRATDCDTFSLRGYMPISMAVVTSDSVNTRPSSTSHGYTALTAQPYKRTENRIQLSVRAKIARGLLKSDAGEAGDQDSIWFGYTQKAIGSYTTKLSRARSGPQTMNPNCFTFTRARSRLRAAGTTVFRALGSSTHQTARPSHCIVTGTAVT